MGSLSDHLRAAANEWRGRDLDFELMKVFLESPADRTEAIRSATPEAKLLMLAIMRFVESALETAEVRMQYKLLGPLLDDTELPPPMCSHWRDLLRAAQQESGVLVLALDDGPLPIRATQPEPPPPDEGDDIGTVLQNMSESVTRFIFAKVRKT